MAHGSSTRRQRAATDPLQSALDETENLLSAPLAPLPDINPLSDFPAATQDLRQWSPEVITPSDTVGTQSNISRPGDASYDWRRVVERTREFMEFPERMASVVTPEVHIRAPEFFRYPERVIECVKRKVRREVMFSLPKRKRRKGAGARRRRDEWSDIHC